MKAYAHVQLNEDIKTHGTQKGEFLQGDKGELPYEFENGLLHAFLFMQD